MEWEDEAVTIVEAIPLPPVIAHYSKMDAECRARKKGLGRVIVDIAREIVEAISDQTVRRTLNKMNLSHICSRAG